MDKVRKKSMHVASGHDAKQDILIAFNIESEAT